MFNKVIPNAKYPMYGVHRVYHKWDTTCILRVRWGTLANAFPSFRLAGNRHQAVSGREEQSAGRVLSRLLSSSSAAALCLRLVAGALQGAGPRARLRPVGCGNHDSLLALSSAQCQYVVRWY